MPELTHEAGRALRAATPRGAALKRLGIAAGMLLLSLPCITQAAFLDMPSIIERPSLDRDSPLQPVEIPEVKERSPDPEAGPHVLVFEIKLQGVNDYPKYDITKKSIDELIEESRRKLMKVDQLLESGFTTEEVGAIGVLLAEIGDGKRIDEINDEDVQRLVSLVKEQVGKRGLTLAQIEAIADQITVYYREHGFFLAKAYVPSQDVQDGVVGLVVLEGDLGDIKVTDNKHYSANMLAREFKGLLGGPVIYEKIEERLYLLNDYPGLEVYGYFKPGKQIGDTQLNINVKREKPYSLSTRLDNHGSDLTGLYRLYGEVLWHNPLRIADQLQVGVLQSISPTNSTYGVAKYQLPLFGARNHASFSATSNQFILDQTAAAGLGGDLGITGETRVLDLGLLHHFWRGRRSNLAATFNFAKKKSTLTSSSGISLGLDDQLDTKTLGVNFDNLLEESHILNQVSVSLSQGKLRKTGILNTDDTFYKLSGNYSGLMFFRIPFTETRTRLILRSALQYTKEVLPSLEQFSIAGANAVRAYPINQFSADSAIYGGVDWVFNLPGFLDYTFGGSVPLNQMLHPTLFLDASGGLQNPIYEESAASRGTLYGGGAGLEFSYNASVSGHVQVAKSIYASFTSEDIEDPGNQVKVLFDLQYVFK